MQKKKCLIFVRKLPHHWISVPMGGVILPSLAAINDNPNGLAMGFPECGNAVAPGGEIGQPIKGDRLPAKRAHVSSDVENHKKRKTVGRKSQKKETDDHR